MPEYGREVWERQQLDHRLTPGQFIEIADGHAAREDAPLLKCNRVPRPGRVHEVRKRRRGARAGGCRVKYLDVETIAFEVLGYPMSSIELVGMSLSHPVDLEELLLIGDAEMRAFPPRLPEQPIFYPVLNEEYARRPSACAPSSLQVPGGTLSCERAYAGGVSISISPCGGISFGDLNSNGTPSASPTRSPHTPPAIRSEMSCVTGRA